ncbi:MAG: 4'-phosphopantetheinyl transferase family protein [Candidatus Sulfotelmatobacter sp.]
MKPRPDKPQWWSEGPPTPRCSRDRIDIWRVLLDQPVLAAQVNNILSPDELGRAKRFHFERDCLHFVHCRSALRSLLGRYLGMSADEIHFEYQPTGKPELAAEQNPGRLEFNVSHSANIALIGVTADRRIGVDIEKIRGDIDTAALSERFFSARERASLEALPQNLHLQAFFACWTRKEAFLKATGAGLSFPLSDFTVSADPDLNPEIEEIRGDAVIAQHWSLADLSPEDGYRATVAAEGPPASVKTYRWN